MEYEYLCKFCDTGIVYRRRRYKFFRNQFTRLSGFCPKCQKFRNANTIKSVRKGTAGMRCPECGVLTNWKFDVTKFTGLICRNCRKRFPTEEWLKNEERKD